MSELMNETTTPFSTHKCPVCNTFGTITRERIKCHGCNGKGYIVIDNRTGFPVEVNDRKNNENDN